MKGKFLVVPRGEFYHAGADVTQVIDGDAIRSMAESFDTSRKLLVDFDHYSDLTADDVKELGRRGIQLPSDAAGWVTDLEEGDDGLYAQIEFTDGGAAALQNKQYRFVSPVFRVDECEAQEGRKVRPRKLAKLGLTNEPNMRSLPALSNKESGADLMCGQLVEIANRKPNKGDEMQEVKKALNLDEAADESAVVDAVEALLNRIADYRRKENEAQADADIESLVEAGHVIENRDELKKQILANRDAVLDAFKLVKAQKPVMPNREQAKPPVDAGEKDFTDIESQLEAYCNRHPGVTRNQAWDALFNTK